MNRLLQNTFFVAALCAAFSAAAFATEVTVYKSPTCSCCEGWIKHMQTNGFTVKIHNVDDVVYYKKANGVPITLGSCHTAKVDGYVIEGHVPASDIKRLLKERPPVRGLSAPGMPNGAPGMVQAGPRVRYDVVSFDNQGNTAVYARH